MVIKTKQLMCSSTCLATQISISGSIRGRTNTPPSRRLCQTALHEVSVKNAPVFFKAPEPRIWEKVTVISAVEAVHVALVPSHAMNGLDFQLGDQSRSPCSDLGAADTGWCPENQLWSVFVGLTGWSSVWNASATALVGLFLWKRCFMWPCLKQNAGLFYSRVHVPSK